MIFDNYIFIVNHHSEAYSYDPVGNRQTGPDKFDSYTYNNGNELLTSTEHPHQKTQNEYDANGNLIKKMETVGKWKTVTSYAYDDENRLITVTIRKGVKTREISFAYDPFGRRISKTVEREEFTDLDDDKENGKDIHHGHDKDGHHDKDHYHGKHGHREVKTPLLCRNGLSEERRNRSWTYGSGCRRETLKDGHLHRFHTHPWS